MADTYPIESQLVIDANGQLLPGGKVYVYDSDDVANTTLLALTDPNGLPISNPITASAISTTPEIRTPVLLVKMVGENGAQLTVLSAKGVVELAQAAAAAAAQSATDAAAAASLVDAPADEAVALLLGSSSQTATALSARVDSRASEQVPGLVASSLAKDATPANAAAAAVDNAMAGKQVAASVETFDADTGFSVVDKDGKRTSIELGQDGKPTTRFAGDIAAAGNMGQGVATFNETFGLSDANGVLIPDAQWGPDGYLAAAAVDRLRPRLDQRQVFNTPRVIKRLPAATDAKLVSAHLNAAKYMLVTWIPSKFPGTTPITSLGGNTEDYVRHPAAAAFSIAAAIFTGVYDSALTGVTLADAKASALRVIKGGALCHKTNTAGGWGAAAGDTAGFYWQESSWAQMYAAAAWMLWADTDAQTKTYVGNMIAAEADNVHTANGLLYWTKFDGTEITPGDSKAEELGWAAGAVAAATVILPTDSRRAAWNAKAQNYMLYANARPSDVLTGASTVQGTKMAGFDGWNVRQDGVIINHGIIHPDYMCAMPEMAWSAGVLWAHAGRRIPAADVHNGEVIYRALSDVRFNGRTIYTPGSWEIFYPQGNDWGTGRMADKAMADVLAHCLGLDSQTTTPAATWADLHLQRCLDMQARFTDGHTYKDTSEDTYTGSEPWVARNLALATLAARIPTTARYDYEPLGA